MKHFRYLLRGFHPTNGTFITYKVPFLYCSREHFESAKQDWLTVFALKDATIVEREVEIPS